MGWRAGAGGVALRRRLPVLRQTVEPWPSYAVRHDRTLRQWYVQTLYGCIPITPGTASGCSSHRARPGSVALGSDPAGGRVVPSNSFAASDARRRSETTSQGIWKGEGSTFGCPGVVGGQAQARSSATWGEPPPPGAAGGRDARAHPDFQS